MCGGGRGGGLGFPTKALTVQNAGPKGPATISKEAGVEGGGEPIRGGGQGVPAVLHSPPHPQAFLFNRNFLKAHTFLLGFMVLIKPESQGQVILQTSWNLALQP